MIGRWLISSSAVLSLALGAQDTAVTKASLMAADRSAAAGADALAKALAVDATVLVPDAPILPGRTAYGRVVVSLVEAPAGRPAWTPVHAVVASGGDFGCTTGVLHLVAAAEAQPVTGRYANCWRLEHGRWMLIAHSRSFSPATVRALPESLPAAPGSTGASAPRPTNAVRAMNAADRAFAQSSAHSGGPAHAFAAWIAADGMMLGGRATPPRGPDGARAAFAGFPAAGQFAWGPVDSLARASRRGDLGFTIGEARIAATPGEVSYSKYLTIWRREPDGSYRFVFDIGSDRPAP
ncbi:MAG: Cif family virulence factor [Gemmatimonadaceae bacterium]